MPNFDSPIGSKKIVGQPLREFDVPDETDPGLNPAMRMRGPSTHGPQLPVDLNAAIAYQQQMNEGDDGEQMADIERQMRAAREAKRTGKTRLNEGARRRIEMLVGMSRTTREAEIDGNKYGLQTLSSKEMRHAIMAASEYDGTVQSPYEIRRQLLGYSLTLVAGLDIVQFVGSNEHEAKLELIDNLPDALLNRLYDEYLEMVKESRTKYAIKNDADAQEVVDDLKK